MFFCPMAMSNFEAAQLRDSSVGFHQGALKRLDDPVLLGIADEAFADSDTCHNLLLLF